MLRVMLCCLHDWPQGEKQLFAELLLYRKKKCGFRGNIIFYGIAAQEPDSDMETLSGGAICNRQVAQGLGIICEVNTAGMP